MESARPSTSNCLPTVGNTSITTLYELLVWAHDDPTGGHFGTVKTYEKLRTRYYWRTVFSDVNHWCRSCCDCAMRKSPRNRHKAPLLPIPVQDAFDRLACDIIGPFPPSKLGNRYVVVFSEYLTKWVETFPVPSIDASAIACLLVDEIFVSNSTGAAMVQFFSSQKDMLPDSCGYFQRMEDGNSKFSMECESWNY